MKSRKFVVAAAAVVVLAACGGSAESKPAAPSLPPLDGVTWRTLHEGDGPDLYVTCWHRVVIFYGVSTAGGGPAAVLARDVVDPPC